MPPFAHQAYQQTAVTAIYDKERLVVMVFEGIAGFLQQVRSGIAQGHKAQKGEAISSVLALLTELDCALDRESGGDLARNLSDLYQWLMGRMSEVNLRDDVDALNDAEKVVLELKEGFEGAARQLGYSNAAVPQCCSRTAETDKTVEMAAGGVAVTQSRRLCCAV